MKGSKYIPPKKKMAMGSKAGKSKGGKTKC